MSVDEINEWAARVSQAFAEALPALEEVSRQIRIAFTSSLEEMTATIQWWADKEAAHQRAYGMGLVEFYAMVGYLVSWDDYDDTEEDD